MVVTDRPASWRAKSRHDRTGVSSTKTVHAPQTPCSHPRCVPVRRRSSRNQSANSFRSGTPSSASSSPFTRTSHDSACTLWACNAGAKHLSLHYALRCSLRDLARREGTAHEHAGHGGSVLGGGVDVVDRIDLASGRSCGRLGASRAERFTDEDLFSSGAANGGGADPAHHDAGIGDQPGVVGFDEGGRQHGCEIAWASSQLLESPSDRPVRCWRPRRDHDVDEQFIVGQRGREPAARRTRRPG